MIVFGYVAVVLAIFMVLVSSCRLIKEGKEKMAIESFWMAILFLLIAAYIFASVL